MSITLLRIAFWNMQSLFDVDSRNPRAPKDANELDARLEVAASVLAELHENRGADLVGLCEVGPELVLARIKDGIKKRTGREYLPCWVPCDGPNQTGLAVLAAADVVSSLNLVDSQRPTAFARPRIMIARAEIGARRFLFRGQPREEPNAEQRGGSTT